MSTSARKPLTRVLLPEAFRGLTPGAQRAVKRHSALLILLAPWGPLWVVLLGLLDWRLGLVLLANVAISAGLIPWLEERSVRAAAHLWAGQTLGLLILISATIGGMWAAAAVWMCVVVLIVGLLRSVRGALPWAAVSAVLSAALLVAEQAGLLAATGLSARLQAACNGVGVGTGLLGLWTVGRILELCRDDALAQQRLSSAQLAAARDEAQAASRAKSTFLATMSHEIRTPMNGVVGVGALLETTALPPEAARLVQVLRQSSESLMGIIDDILDFSKIEAGYMELEEVDYAPQQLLAEIQALYQARAVEKGLRLTIYTDNLPDRLIGDPLRLRQIVGNLTNNAIKFTASGEVRLKMEARSERLCIAVEDTGPGVSLAQQRRLFQPFQQAESATTRRHGGTGLGLAICRQLTELMGGQIGVFSDGVRGSRFWVTLPLHVSESDTEEATVLMRSLIRGRVLLVEDHPVNQLVAERLLSEMGCDVVLATDGAEGVEAAAADTFDVILMDCQMPEMDGYEATRAIRCAGIETPIIALSADVTGASRAEAAAAGMDDYLTKPIQRGALRRALLLGMARCSA